MVSEEQNSDVELASEVIPVPQVQPEVEAPEVMDVTNEETNNIPRGKSRQRKRALHAAILKQMEFYFGDSNLSKDRFLAELIKRSPDVHLETFLRFNRIRSLTTDLDRIAKALRKSTMLEVSEDGTKVRRITPIVEKQNVDECTVYVQRLPSDADHEWLSKLFSEYGPVAYVSIPKFKINHKIKGFAFVEFETPEGAQKCLKAFRTKGCELPSHTSPTDVLSITTFAEEEKQEKNGHQNSEKSAESSLDIKSSAKKEQTITKSSESEEPKPRKRKESIKSDEPEDSEIDHSDSTKSKIKKECDGNDKDSSTCLSDSNTEKEEKRGKKRKNRHSLEEVHDPETESNKSLKESSKKHKKKTGESEVAAVSEGVIKNETDIDGEKKAKKSKTKEPEEETEPESSLSDSNTEKEEKRGKKRKNRHSLEVYDPETESNKSLKVSSKKHKRKTGESEVAAESEGSTKNETDTDGGKKAKKPKIKEPEEETEPESSIKNETDKKDTEETVECSNDEDAPEKKKKNRKRKYRACETLQTVDMGLQVMGKRDWKRLRNKYLELQRAKMKQLKQNVKRARWNQWGDRNNHEETAVNKKENPASKLEFVPNVIVKVELNEPCIDPKGFKAELKSSSSNIKYIDVKESSHVAYVRCDSSEGAKTLAEKATEDRQFTVLTGDEELSYWDKITKDREEKIGNKIRVNQRGRDKLLKKAEKELGKHIKFDEV